MTIPPNEGPEYCDESECLNLVVNRSTFDQILELDEVDVTRDFSRAIVVDFFEQAHRTFIEIDAAVVRGDRAALHSSVYFLRGSASTLGFDLLRARCVEILETNHCYGAAPDAEIIRHLAVMVESVRAALKEVETMMRKFREEGFDGGCGDCQAE